ncbi:hypothetical protein BH23BAC3_BH23BAC3_35920 [soil metagenome]
MVYFFLVLVLTTSLNISHADSYDFERQISVEDSVVQSDVNQEALQAYQEILEKTNQQLSRVTSIPHLSPLVFPGRVISIPHFYEWRNVVN